MKVGTDGILLGSWVASKAHHNALDIGTGSGLLAIMIAQKVNSECHILGIDIESSALEQATENGNNCPWAAQLSFAHCALQDLDNRQQFDLIVSNPPFFTGNCLSEKANNANPMGTRRRLARHDNSLTLPELLKHVHRLLTGDGKFYCVLPAEFPTLDSELADASLFVEKRLLVQSVKHKPAKRQLLCISKHLVQTQTSTLVIQTRQGQYTDQYQDICRDYYLNF